MVIRVHNQNQINGLRQVWLIGSGLNGSHVVQPLLGGTFPEVTHHRWLDVHRINRGCGCRSRQPYRKISSTRADVCHNLPALQVQRRNHAIRQLPRITRRVVKALGRLLWIEVVLHVVGMGHFLFLRLPERYGDSQQENREHVMDRKHGRLPPLILSPEESYVSRVARASYLSLPFTKSTDFSSASSAESSNASPWGRSVRRSEERRVGKECRSRWSPHH